MGVTTKTQNTYISRTITPPCCSILYVWTRILKLILTPGDVYRTCAVRIYDMIWVVVNVVACEIVNDMSVDEEDSWMIRQTDCMSPADITSHIICTTVVRFPLPLD